MKNRIHQATQAAHAERRKIFCAFLTAGFPSLKITESLILEFDRHGVDVLELGFPFSDPLADGPTIQYASEQALKNRVTVSQALHLVKSIRKQGVKLPIVFFTYLNPIHRFGYERFVKQAAAAGIDGLLVPDLPLEEESRLSALCRKHGLLQIFLIAPTTSKDRSRLIVRKSEGFIYYVSLRGVTGARNALPADIKQHIQQIKRGTQKPVLVGFGVSNPKQAARLSRYSDGVIIGSAIIDCLRRRQGKQKAIQFVQKIRTALNRAGSR